MVKAEACIPGSGGGGYGGGPGGYGGGYGGGSGFGGSYGGGSGSGGGYGGGSGSGSGYGGGSGSGGSFGGGSGSGGSYGGSGSGSGGGYGGGSGSGGGTDGDGFGDGGFDGDGGGDGDDGATDGDGFGDGGIDGDGGGDGDDGATDGDGFGDGGYGGDGGGPSGDGDDGDGGFDGDGGGPSGDGDDGDGGFDGDGGGPSGDGDDGDGGFDGDGGIPSGDGDDGDGGFDGDGGGPSGDGDDGDGGFDGDGGGPSGDGDDGDGGFDGDGDGDDGDGGFDGDGGGPSGDGDDGDGGFDGDGGGPSGDGDDGDGGFDGDGGGPSGDGDDGDGGFDGDGGGPSGDGDDGDGGFDGDGGGPSGDGDDGDGGFDGDGGGPSGDGDDGDGGFDGDGGGPSGDGDDGDGGFDGDGGGPPFRRLAEGLMWEDFAKTAEGDTGDTKNQGFGSLASGRSLQSDTTVVTGFGTDGKSETGSTSYSWTGNLQASPGNYRVCWCSGLGDFSGCGNEFLYQHDVGSIMVTGPNSGQAFFCTKGQSCINQGPILGVGLRAEDQIWVRTGCELSYARAYAAGTDIAVQANVSGATGQGDATDLYISLNLIFEGVPIPAGDVAICWCSSLGQNCSDMDLTPGSTSSVYLEVTVGTFTIEGPGTGAEIGCYLGQVCRPQLPRDGAKNLKPNDALSAMESCGDGNFLPGLPYEGIATTSDGYNFEFLNSSGSPYVATYPGYFRLCWCRPSNYLNCDQPSDFTVAAGLFVAQGPYSGQTHACNLGSQCIVSSTELRGVGLESGDKLMPMVSCDPLLGPSRNFPAVPVVGQVAGSNHYFDLGELGLNGTRTEVLELCWCSGGWTCEGAQYRQVAMTLYVNCPPGWYELQDATSETSGSLCQECPVGYYCPGGLSAPLTSCPVGSISPRGAASSAQCFCRGGFYWVQSLGACLACPVGFYKDHTGRDTECSLPCPDGTSSSGGAANVWECSCQGDTIDTESGLETFQCTDLGQLSLNSSENVSFAATEANVSLFNLSLLVTDASSDTLLADIMDRLSQFLDISNLRASLESSVRLETSSWYVDVKAWSSDAGIATQLQHKFDLLPFETWISSEMTGTALDSAALVSRSEVESFLLQCPSGLGLREGRHIIDVNDCMCPHGKQPAVSGGTGLAWGCVSCPIGSYKSSIGDTPCVSCPVEDTGPWTTLQAGAMSYSACIFFCPAGTYASNPQNPSSCDPCDYGFYCPYQRLRQACLESESTLEMTATLITDCKCAKGFRETSSGVCEACSAGKYKSFVGNADCLDCAAGTFSTPGSAICTECAAGRFSTIGAGSCQACPAGRYSPSIAATSLDACIMCSVGTWGNQTAASQISACMPCVPGSTTALPAANTDALCARPSPGQSKACISGRICFIEILGSSLQDGHQLAITSSLSCTLEKTSVPNIISGGISEVATEQGTSYEWGNVYSDFTPLGGVYNLCWCANMGSLTCDNLNNNFVLSAGQLLVTGPSYHQLQCLRGSDCIDLAFNGYDLILTDQIAVRTDGCGGAIAAQISIANINGLGNLQASGTSFLLGFGVSSSENDYHLYIDASNTGYFLCWCASARGLTTTCSGADFAVDAGRLRVIGPNVNQESACAVGQECSVSGIRGVDMQNGDRLMILSDCGRGNAILGLPANGILDTTDGSNFAFEGVSSVVLSVPGIFRICFCRPANGNTCGAPEGFQARVGLMTASGPFEQTTVCQLGSNCTVEVSGIGLEVGDQLFFTHSACGSSDSLSQKGFTSLKDPLQLEFSGSLQVSLGELPLSANPGLYYVCWCPKSAACTTPSLFRAPAGQLEANCPPGTYALGSASSGRQEAVCWFLS